MMIEIRRLAPEDLPQLDRIHTIVYNERRDYAEQDGEGGTENSQNNSLRHPAEWSWGAFEGGKLLSGMHEIDFLMRFDGKNARMSGIGGVATLPEARRGGLVRRIFEKMLPEAYEKGVIFSSLSPFSHEFYRMFGYELACAYNEITIAAKDFMKLEQKGEFVPVFPGDESLFAPLQKVHSAYIRDINHGICRDSWPDMRGWKRFTENDPYNTGTFLYLWKDEDGTPRSYIKYKDKGEDDDGGHIMQVLELAFADREGLYGALALVGGLSAQFKQFQWTIPAFIDPCDFIDDTWEIDQHLSPRDMTRVVNVKAALEMMRFYGEGSYVIEVEDAPIPANGGRYLVEFGGGSAGGASPGCVRVSLTKKDADMRCDICTLSQLVLGYRTLENALRSRRIGLEVYGNRETLDRVFTLRPQHITEYF